MSDDGVALETSIPYETLDTTLDVLRTVSDEAVLRIGKDGISTAVIDPANVCAQHLEVRPPAFDITPSGQFALGVNLERFQEMIGKADSDQSILLAFDTEKRKLNIQYANKDLRLAAIDPDSIRDPPDQPDLDLPNQFGVGADTWRDALETTEMVSDHVYIDVEKDDAEVVVRGRGDIDETDVTLDGVDDLIEASLKEDTRGIYSLDYLVGKAGKGNNGVANPVPSDAEVTITIGEEFPMWMDYEYAGGDASVRTMLAPRIDSS